MKPLEVNSNTNSPGNPVNMLETEELYSLLGLLVVEGRVPAPNAKGRCIGPHAYRPGETTDDHTCDSSKQCVQASVYRDQFFRLGHHGAAVLIDTLLIPECEKHTARSTDSPVDGILLEQWTIKLLPKKQCPDNQPESVTTLLQTILSYLHFSQLSNWLSESEGCWPRNIQFKITSHDSAVHHDTHDTLISMTSYSFPLVSVGESNNLEVSLRAQCKSWSELSLNCISCNHSSFESTSDSFNNNQCLPTSNELNPLSLPQTESDATHSVSQISPPVENSKRQVPASISVDSVIGLSSKNKRPNSIFQNMSKSKSSKFSRQPNSNKHSEKEDKGETLRTSKCRKSISEHDNVLQLEFRREPFRETLVSPMVLYSDDSESPPPCFHTHEVSALRHILSDRLGKNLTPHLRKESLDDVISDFSQMKMKAPNYFKVDQDNNNIFPPGRKHKKKREWDILISESSHANRDCDKSPKKCLKLSSDTLWGAKDKSSDFHAQRRCSEEINRDFLKEKLFNNRSRPRCSEAKFNYRTRLPLQSSPVPVKRNLSGKFDSDKSMPSLKIARSASSPEFEEQEDDIVKHSKQFLSSSAPVNASSTNNRLVVNFEESMLNCRIQPVGLVEGFSLEIGASGDFCPPHLRLPLTAYFFHLSDDNSPSPYLGHVDLTQLANKRGYHIPKKGSLQLTLFNPSGTVLKMFVVVYDLSNMPPNSKTFLRQRTIYMPISMTTTVFQSQLNAWKSAGQNPFVKNTEEEEEAGDLSNSSPSKHLPNINESSVLPAYLRYLVHLRFHTAKSGKMYLHSDVRLIFSRDKFEFDPRIATYELRSFIEAPQNPRYSPKK